MSDLEITKLCAAAMGYEILAEPNERGYNPVALLIKQLNIRYDPLHDDAQAMALVKKFRLIIEPDGTCPECDYWGATWLNASKEKGKKTTTVRKAITLNAAICGCIAKMQAAK